MKVVVDIENEGMRLGKRQRGAAAELNSTYPGPAPSSRTFPRCFSPPRSAASRTIAAVVRFLLSFTRYLGMLHLALSGVLLPDLSAPNAAARFLGQ